MVLVMRRKAFRMTPSYRILDVIVIDNAPLASQEQSSTHGFEIVVPAMEQGLLGLKPPEFGRLEALAPRFDFAYCSCTSKGGRRMLRALSPMQWSSNCKVRHLPEP